VATDPTKTALQVAQSWIKAVLAAHSRDLSDGFHREGSEALRVIDAALLRPGRK
jgi:hypothetical protein